MELAAASRVFRTRRFPHDGDKLVLCSKRETCRLAKTAWFSIDQPTQVNPAKIRVAAHLLPGRTPYTEDPKKQFSHCENSRRLRKFQLVPRLARRHGIQRDPEHYCFRSSSEYFHRFLITPRSWRLSTGTLAQGDRTGDSQPGSGARGGECVRYRCPTRASECSVPVELSGRTTLPASPQGVIGPAFPAHCDFLVNLK
jgi:hypothetical protein